MGGSEVHEHVRDRRALSKGPPYRLTAGLLLGSILVSQAIPVAKDHFAGNVPPLLAQLHPSVGPWLVIAVAAVLSMIALLPRALEWGRTAFLATVVAAGWVVSVALAAQAKGLSAVSAPFRRPLDYYASVPLVRALGARAFAVDFPRLQTRLSLHARTHGPSAVLFPWLLSKMTAGSVLGVSLLVALVGLAGAIATYFLARELASERTARLAAILFACAPGVLLYSATSMDAVFMTVIAFALAALVRFPRSTTWAVVAGMLWAVSLSFTFGAAVLALFGAGIGWMAVRAPDGQRAATSAVVVRGVLVLAGLAAGGLILWRLAGIDLIADFRAASRAAAHDPSRARPYLYWVLFNLPAFLIVAGIPQTALLLHETPARWRARSFGFETVLWATLALASLSGVFLGEVDHIWLFFVPPLAASAAAGLERVLAQAEDRSGASARRTVTRVAAGALVQTTAMQLLLYTYW